MRIIRENIVDVLKRKIEADETIKEIKLSESEWNQLVHHTGFTGHAYVIQRAPKLDIPAKGYCNCCDITYTTVEITRDFICNKRPCWR